MARRQISNELRAALEPLIPAFSPSPKGGRRRTVDDRAALNGILYVLQTGIPWEDLPQKLDFGSGMSCWRRLREHDQIDWERASLDAASVSTPWGSDRDDAEYAVPLVKRPALAEGIHARSGKPVLHGDNGSTLKATTVLAMLNWLGVKPSYSRPRVSDDNAFVESLFKTARYRPEFPVSGFADLADARA